jgi:hypothetical protein
MAKSQVCITFYRLCTYLRCVVLKIPESRFVLAGNSKSYSKHLGTTCQLTSRDHVSTTRGYRESGQRFGQETKQGGAHATSTKRLLGMRYVIPHSDYSLWSMSTGVLSRNEMMRIRCFSALFECFQVPVPVVCKPFSVHATSGLSPLQV